MRLDLELFGGTVTLAFTPKPTLTFDIKKRGKTPKAIVITHKRITVPDSYSNDINEEMAGTHTLSKFTSVLFAIDPKLELMKKISPFRIKTGFRSKAVPIWPMGKELVLLTGNDVYKLITENNILVCELDFFRNTNKACESICNDKQMIRAVVAYIFNRGISRNRLKNVFGVEEHKVYVLAEKIMRPSQKSRILNNSIQRDTEKFFKIPRQQITAMAY